MINIQNTDDNDCFRWFLGRYLNPADGNPARITKADKDFTKKIDFKGIKCSVETKEIHKIEFRSSWHNHFVYENKVKYPMYQKNVVMINMFIYY